MAHISSFPTQKKMNIGTGSSLHNHQVGLSATGSSVAVSDSFLFCHGPEKKYGMSYFMCWLFIMRSACILGKISICHSRLLYYASYNSSEKINFVYQTILVINNASYFSSSIL